MSAMTDYLEGKLGNHVLNGILFPQTTSGLVYVALFSGGVTSATWGETLTSGGQAQGEITGLTGYARISVTSGWTMTSSGLFSNTSTISFGIASGAGGWGTISGVAIFDALVSGNALLYGTVATPKLVASGDSAAYQAGQFVIQWL